MYHRIEGILRQIHLPVKKIEIDNDRYLQSFNSKTIHYANIKRISLPDANFWEDTPDHRTWHRKNGM